MLLYNDSFKNRGSKSDELPQGDSLSANFISASERPRVQGKFLFVGEEKLYLRGVTYGTFNPDGGSEYDPEKVEFDFSMMAENGINTIRVYTVPPRWLLDSAARYGLRVMIGLPWEQHIAFLDDAKIVKSIESRVREAVRACAGHPAVLCYAIGNEIPAPVVRWYGAKRVEKFLHSLYKIAKAEDPRGLVTYVNFPSTEYLDLPFVDFICFNVYLESEEKFDAYLARLQNIAGDRPLVMAEIGLDSQRNGLEKQAEMLDWQVRMAFAAGCAGIYVFSWTDEWFRGGLEIEDWDFGLTTRSRTAKPALEAVRNAFAEIPFPAGMKFPRISVVVCSYNGSRTIRDCMEGLMRLDYPDFEVIVVNDGSTDNTAEIVSEYPFKLISTPNMGLSSARNTGMIAATGEIVAYTDDDAHPDPHWLKYLAAAFLKTEHAGIGGPNIAPRGDGEIAECVANAPGGPVHVLVSDTEAEHIPGCNMAFRREALKAIGGFDPQYRAAGDDVDVCWRIQEKGWTLGFSPAAMVWHHRRNSIRDYWRQQKGYGKAEALLERKWADKYNAAGHLTWTGRLYGKGLTEAVRLRRGRIYQGVWGTAPFQSIYQPANGLVESLPLMPEWYLVVVILTLLVSLGFFWQPLFWLAPLLIVAVGAPVVQAISSGFKSTFLTKPENHNQEIKMFLITSFLHLMQPFARLIGRFANGLTPWRRRGSELFVMPFAKTVSYWSENWRDITERLSAVEKTLQSAGSIAQRNSDFDEGWDLQVRGGIFGNTRLLVLTEEHGQGKQVIRVRTFAKGTFLVYASVAILALLSLLAFRDGAILAAITIGFGAVLVVTQAVLEAGYSTGAVLQSVDKVREDEEGVVLSPDNHAAS
jgi:O-antigen biosynthesis protein